MLRFQFDIDGIIRKDVNIKSNDVITTGETALTDTYMIFDREENVVMTPEEGRYYGSVLKKKQDNPAYSVYDSDTPVIDGYLNHYIVNEDGTFTGLSGETSSIESYTAYSGINNPAIGKTATAVLKGVDDD